jgi:hypothetical protein
MFRKESSVIGIRIDPEQTLLRSHSKTHGHDNQETRISRTNPEQKNEHRAKIVLNSSVDGAVPSKV